MKKNYSLFLPILGAFFSLFSLQAFAEEANQQPNKITEEFVCVKYKDNVVDFKPTGLLPPTDYFTGKVHFIKDENKNETYPAFILNGFRYDSNNTKASDFYYKLVTNCDQRYHGKYPYVQLKTYGNLYYENMLFPLIIDGITKYGVAFSASSDRDYGQVNPQLYYLHEFVANVNGVEYKIGSADSSEGKKELSFYSRKSSAGRNFFKTLKYEETFQLNPKQFIKVDGQGRTYIETFKDISFIGSY